MIETYRSRGFAPLFTTVIHALSPTGLKYRLAKRREDASFDARYGTETGGVTHLGALETLGPHSGVGVDHVASPRAEYDAAMALLDLPEQGLTFVDLGAGKGRALLYATERPSARIIGVEFARELHEVATHNLALRSADDRLEILHAYAAGSAFP